MKPQQAAGILFRKNNRWLLIERKNRPFGFGIPAGHSEKWESPEETAMREAGEEIRSRSQGKLKLKKAFSLIRLSRILQDKGNNHISKILCLWEFQE